MARLELCSKASGTRCIATKDGLCSDRIRGIQEDTTGNIYFTTYEGISKFDGRSFTTLSVLNSSTPTDWKKHADDLWFIGPPDAGVVFRYNGNSLHRLEFPKTTCDMRACVRSVFMGS